MQPAHPVKRQISKAQIHPCHLTYNTVAQNHLRVLKTIIRSHAAASARRLIKWDYLICFRKGVGAPRYETALRRGDQPREHLRRARVSILRDTNVLRAQLPVMRAIGYGHNRIDAGWAIASVCPKSAPLNNSGARMTADTA